MNNLSVLPWYGNIYEQNARRWWVYGRVYPLFCPVERVLPFQIARGAYREAITADSYGTAEVPSGNGVIPSGIDSVVGYYQNVAFDTILFYDIPAAPLVPGEDTYMAIALDSNGDIIGTFNPIVSGTYTGAWVLPEGTVEVDVLLENPNEADAPGWVSSLDEAPEGITAFEVYTREGVFVADYTAAMQAAISIEGRGTRDILIYPDFMPILTGLEPGQYYCRMADARHEWWSEVFTAVADSDRLLKIEWWDAEDFVMDAGVIVYKFAGGTQFKNRLYLKAEIAKPEYTFEEEGETRDGYFFPTKQISEKRYKFAFMASEYLLDVMRFIRLSDFVQISNGGRVYIPDSFLITPEWEADGDVAGVSAEFDTDTVAKKIGLAYLRARRGDFNNDFNDDFNNE